MEKWPVLIEVVKVSRNHIDKDQDTYFISGMMNKEQCLSLEQRLPVLAKFWIDPNKVVVSTVVSHQTLEEVYKLTSELARTWRGQYQVLMKVFSQECKEAMEV